MNTRLGWSALLTIALTSCSGDIGDLAPGSRFDASNDRRDGSVDRRDGSIDPTVDGGDGDGDCTGAGCSDGGGTLVDGGPDGGVVEPRIPVGGPLFDDEVRASAAFGIWRDEVQPLIASDCGGCHLGQRFAFASLRRAGATFTDAETVDNYKRFFPMISLDNPSLSRLLTKLLPPTEAAAQQHGGGVAAQVTGVTDATYVTLASWVNAEKARRCPNCGVTASHAYIAYVDRPDTHWAIDRSPSRTDYGFRHGAKIMMQPVDPATGTPLASTPPVEFLPSTFCGAAGACDFGALAANYHADQLVFECRLSLTGEAWLDLAWNLCIAEIGADGKAVNPRFVRPAAQRHSGWTIARGDPYMIADGDGLPLYGIYDEHGRMRRKEDRFPVFSPDDSWLYLSARDNDPRTGVRGSETYHGVEITNNVIAMDLNGGHLRSVYLNEGGSAEHITILRNGNLAVHTWNLERMDRHLYTQIRQDGMMELPVLLGRTQGNSMWGSLAELPGGAFIGATGRRRGSVELFQAFVADHTLGTGLDPAFVSFVELDPPLEAEMAINIGLCNSPPSGPNCSTARYYDELSYAPLDGALVSYNPVRTYYGETNVNDNLFQDLYGAARGDFASMQPYLPEQRVAFIDRKGQVTELIQPGTDRALRFPTWVGLRQAPILQESLTDEAQDSAEFHIADVPIWFAFQDVPDASQATLMSSLDQITAVRVLVKVLEDNDCLNDGIPVRKSTYLGNQAGIVDHPTHLGISNGTGYLHLKVPVALGGDAYGNVPVKADRSVRMRLPAGRLLLLQGIDADGHMVAQHTRLFSLPPGQQIDTSVRRQHYAQQCMACHGSLAGGYSGLAALGPMPAVMDFATQAKADPLVDLTDAAVPASELTFLHALRPILDAKCVSCHSGATPAAELTLESTYSATANYPAGRWAQAPYTLAAYLNFVPVADRVPGYNWSTALAYVLARPQQIETFIPDNDPYKPQGGLSAWDPGYQMLFMPDSASVDRFYYLTDYLYGIHVGRGGRYSNTSYLIEVLTGQNLSARDYAGAQAHTGMLTAAEVRTIMALIDNGMPFMARCSDKTVSSGPNAGGPWGEPVSTVVQ